MAYPTPVVEIAARSFTGVSIAPVTIAPISISISVPSITPFTYTPVHRTDCVTATPDVNGFVPASACNALWEYFPSMAGAVIMAMIFGALLITHTTQAFWFKKKFCWVIIVATAWELGSFVTRALAVHQQQNSALATVSQLLVLLAPLWINAFVYMVLARMIYFLVPSHKLYGLRASLIAFIFVCLDIVSFFIQLVGGFIAAPGAPPAQIQSGLHVYVAGIGIQEFWISVVLVFAVLLWTETRRLERRANGGLLPAHQRAWRRNLAVLYAVLGLITVRVVYRLVEFSSGESTTNPVPFTEWYFYVFDAVPMAIATALLSLLHPGAFLRGPFSDFPKLSEAQRKEVKAARKDAKAVARARGARWFERYRAGREAKNAETERLAAQNWGVSADTKAADGYVLGDYGN